MLLIAVVERFQEAGIVAGAFVAVITAAVMLARKLHQMGSWLHTVHEIVERELQHDHGQSMKDQLTDVRTEQERLRSTLDEHVSDIEAHAADPTAHIRPSWPDAGGAGPR